MADHRRNLLVDILVPIVLAAGVVPPLFYHTVVLSTQQPDNRTTFESFASGMSGYVELKTAWKTRLFSNALAWQSSRFSAWILDRLDFKYINRPLPLTIALWTVGWFAAISLLYVLFTKRRAAFFILATYAAISFGYQDKLPTTRIYPWDMPALFIFVLFVFLLARNRFRWLLVLLPLGMGFKETAGVLCVAFLFASELPPRRRWTMFVGAAALCAGVKLGIDSFTRSSSPLLTMETGLGGEVSALYLLRNLRSLSSVVPVLVNAGTLLAFFFLPAPDGKTRTLRIVAAAFVAGNFLFGTVLEYRIWFELIPFALYVIEKAAFGSPPSDTPLAGAG
jgi:hypothetical protein